MKELNDIAVCARKISKKYNLYSSSKKRILSHFTSFKNKDHKDHKEFWALKDVSFEITKGSTVGILGLNGAGKSTLLKIISAMIPPTHGEILTQGRIQRLELGSAFNRELTGRANVKLLLELQEVPKAEMDNRMEEIIAFADIGDFIDYPIKTYSSGMVSRLSFGASVYVDPDILIIDEALAVGDAKFKEKCNRKFQEFKKAGITIILVSHDKFMLTRQCTHGILLHRGQLVEMGEPKRIISLYDRILSSDHNGSIVTKPQMNDVAEKEGVESRLNGKNKNGKVDIFLKSHSETIFELNPTYNKYEDRSGDKRAEIIDYLISVDGEINPIEIKSGVYTDIYLKIKYHEKLEKVLIGILVKTNDGLLIHGTRNEFLNVDFKPGEPGEICIYKIRVKMDINRGDCFLSFAVAESDKVLCDFRNSSVYLKVVDDNPSNGLVKLETGISQILTTEYVNENETPKSIN